MFRSKKISFFFSIILILLLSIIFSWNIFVRQTLSTPEDTLTEYLTEVQKRPFSYERAISYVDYIVLDDEFLNSIKAEARDVNFPVYSDFNFVGSTIYNSDKEASIAVELIFDGDYNIKKIFDLKKVEDEWKIDLRNAQHEYYSILDEQ